MSRPKGFKHTKATKKKISIKAEGHSFRGIHKQSEEHKIKRGCYRRLNNHPNWKGGKYLDRDGYVLFYNGNKYIKEHRFIIEQMIGRHLKPQEIVHHINNIKTDNRPENLMAFSNHSIHLRFESQNIIKSKDVIFDGRKF